MKSTEKKANLKAIGQQLQCRSSQSIEKCIMRGMTGKIFEDQVIVRQNPSSISWYTEKIKLEGKWIQSYLLNVDQRSYIFDKILPLQRRCGSQQNPMIKYFIPSQIFTILSPLFLNGLGGYLQKHEKFESEKNTFIKCQYLQRESQIINIIIHEGLDSQKLLSSSAMEEDFLTYFLKKYKEDGHINELIQSILKLNYFNISDIAKSSIIRNLTQKHMRGKFTSYFELYRGGCQQLKNEIISNLIGKSSELSQYKYCQFYESHAIYTPYCIKYEDDYVAILYLVRLKCSEYEKRVKNTALRNDLRRENIEEVLYVSSLYVLPKYKGIGHGKNIINLLKKQGTVVLLCSSATSQSSGLEDHLGTGYFYRKCQFKEYYPVETSAYEELDQGCLLQSEEHDECSPFECKHPVAKYHDESYYIFDPEGRI